jgi:hypothetical protein
MRLINKFTHQRYKVTVRDVKTNEILLQRRDMDGIESMEVFNGLREHFCGDIQATVRIGNAYVRNEEYGVMLEKERRKRLL